MTALERMGVELAKMLLDVAEELADLHAAEGGDTMELTAQEILAADILREAERIAKPHEVARWPRAAVLTERNRLRSVVAELREALEYAALILARECDRYRNWGGPSAECEKALARVRKALA